MGDYAIYLTEEQSAGTDTPTTLALGQKTTAHIAPGRDDVDWFELTVTQGNVYTVEVTANFLRNTSSELEEAAFPTIIGLYDNSAAAVPVPAYENCAKGTPGYLSTLTFHAQETGPYYVAVQGRSNDWGLYDVEATDRGPADSLDILANVTTQASMTVGTRFDSDDFREGEGIRGNSAYRDSDWIRISLSADTSYRVRVRAASIASPPTPRTRAARGHAHTAPAAPLPSNASAFRRHDGRQIRCTAPATTPPNVDDL